MVTLKRFICHMSLGLSLGSSLLATRGLAEDEVPFTATPPISSEGAPAGDRAEQTESAPAARSPFAPTSYPSAEGGAPATSSPFVTAPVPEGAGQDSWCSNEPLLGWMAHSDYCFDKFISPQTNPLFFEDPRTLTEIRMHYVNQWIPDSNPVFQGGQAHFIAAQVRVALSERLSFIATKDGYLWLDSENPALGDNDGWADVAAGLKYNLIRDVEQQHLLSAGFTFELDVGSHKVFQGRGDGEFHLFLSNGMAFGDCNHWLSATGFRLPTDTQDRSQMWYWSNHWDRELVENLYGVIELNWFHWLQSGNALPVNFEGNDIATLGATNVAGNDIVTAGFGTRYKFGTMHEIGLAYEIPLTQRKDLLQSRLYLDLILRY